MKRIVVGISGASGVIMGYRLLGVLRSMPEVETHLVMTRGAAVNFSYETSLSTEEVEAAADFRYRCDDIAAPIASGSFEAAGMIVLPCSMKTVAGIATGFSENLLLRAADVTLKERRPLVLAVREMPLSVIHLRNILTAAEAGALIIPPMLTFYNGAASVNEQVDHIIGRILQQFSLKTELLKPWTGARPKYTVPFR